MYEPRQLLTRKNDGSLWEVLKVVGGVSNLTTIKNPLTKETRDMKTEVVSKYFVPLKAKAK